MGMTDWLISSYTDPLQAGQTWVYYENKNFPGIHFSASVDNPDRSHMGLDGAGLYYFGATRTFNNPAAPAADRQRLEAAWRDRFTVG